MLSESMVRANQAKADLETPHQRGGVLVGSAWRLSPTAAWARPCQHHLPVGGRCPAALQKASPPPPRHLLEVSYLLSGRGRRGRWRWQSRYPRDTVI